MGSSYDDHPLCVTLERDVAIPGNDHEPNATSVFRARERSIQDDTMRFFGLLVGPENTVVEVSKDNVRGVVNLGEESP